MRYMLISLFALSPVIAAAQQPDTQPEQPIDEVVTIGKRTDNPFEVVGNVAKLNEEQLKRISAFHIQDALVRVPGVSMQQGNGQESLPAVRSPVLTGAGACGAFLTMQDSIPLRAAGFCNVNELFESYSEVARAIEVVRGPGNALYGSNAVHGVINVLLPTAPQAFESTVGFELGENNYRREHVSVGNRFDNQAFVANVTAAHDGGFRDDAYYDQQKMQLRHEIELTNWNIATTFAATNLNQETAGFIEGKDSYKDDDLITENLDPQAYRDVQSFRLYSRMERKFGDDNSLVVTPYARKSDMDFLQHFLPGLPLEQNGQDSVGVMLAWYADGLDNVRLISGLDTELTDGYLKETQDDPTDGSAFLQATIPVGKHYDYQVDALQIAPYVQADWTPIDAVTITAGIRYEMMDYDYDNRMIDGRTMESGVPCGFGGCRFNRPADREDTFKNWSPKFGVLYRVTDGMNVFANIAKGFRAPQATELYRLQNDQDVADLDSEEINSVEVGLRGRTSQLYYEVNVYAMDKTNVIFQDSARINHSDGATEHFGVELDLRYQFNETWDAGLVANYGDHTYSKELEPGVTNIKGNQVDTAPKHFGTARLGAQFASNIRAELEYAVMGKYFTDPENVHSYDGHDLFNLRMQWQATDQLDISFRILNLTDERYAERADYTTFNGDRYFPGEPRSFYAGVEYAF